jgi:hypothetical protein
VNRPDSRLPSQLRVVGATDLERRLLEAGARELPSVELTKKMQQALGISIGIGAATAGTAKAATAVSAGAGAAAPAFSWSAISVGVLALAVTGAVVGVHTAGIRHTALKPFAAAVAPPAVVPTLPTAPAAVPAAAAVASPVAVASHRTIAAPAHRRAALAPPPSDLRGEIALVDAARTAVANGADDRALALLGRYDASHPRGTFRPEVAALRIQTLEHLGHRAQARAMAQKFVAAHPDSPLAERVAQVTGLTVR